MIVFNKNKLYILSTAEKRQRSLKAVKERKCGMDLGRRIKELRLEKNMLQKELAAQLQVSTGTVCNYEKNTHFPDGDALCKIADIFGVSIDYLMGRTNFRSGLDALTLEISPDFLLADLVNEIVSLDVQHQKEICQFTAYQKFIFQKCSNQQLSKSSKTKGINRQHK